MSKSTVSAASGNGYLEFEKPLARIEQEIVELEGQQGDSSRDLSTELRTLRQTLREMTKQTYSKLTAWETVQVARHPARPILRDYIRMMAKDFVELHGDRTAGDDQAMVCGFARIAGQRVMLIGHNKGKDTKEKIACNFGCAHPEGYRKAMLKMKLAEKYKLPVVCLIDTQGAYPGVAAEERGIAQAIAVNLMEMARLRTPIMCVVIGEGGSGGALGIGVGDRMALFENSFYSVISPEGCAAILFKTGDQARRAAESLRLTSKELKKLELIDDIIREPLGGAHRDPDESARQLESYISKTLRELKRVKLETLMKRRYDRIRNIGAFFESESEQTPKPPAKKKGRAGRTADSGSTRRRTPAAVSQ